ncbi:Retrotransposon polyprotein [Penicillium brevicompactum]|uniref:Retrotransposon polyprotein n=1 Tax=Penicillium brevicompactum TaxID=5074 RepID=A0A9W9UAD2_PENBR|nr:Retrotransposon polyprotein [Penicillium brevicompactum]
MALRMIEKEGDNLKRYFYENIRYIYKGYIQYLKYSNIAIIICYDKTCITYKSGKLNYGIESRPL